MTEPRVATWLLERFVPGNRPLTGDLVEEWRQRRSRSWYWRQVLMAIRAEALWGLATEPWRSGQAVLTGWFVLLGIFFGLGDTVAEALAWQIWGWTRETGYGSGLWWPFHLAAACVSYGGFAMSAWVVTQQHRPRAASVLFAYLVSVLTVLLASAVFIAWRAPQPLPVPHGLFYLVSVMLPSHGRVGVALVPVVVLFGGLVGTGCGRPTRSFAG